MIVGIAEEYHDYQLQMYMVDTARLLYTNPVDRTVMAALEANETRAYVNACNWDRPNSGFDGEPQITQSAKVVGQSAERLLHLIIAFE